jgi:hypothetical protein
MKVKELMEMLATFDPDAEVILQKDAEGNGYSPLEVADDNAVYVPENTWSGTVYDTEWSAEDADMEEGEWAALLTMPRCVVLAPVN